MTKKIEFNEENYLGYNFFIQKKLDYAFDPKRNVLIFLHENSSFLNGVINFVKTEVGYKLRFKNSSAIILELLDNNVWITMEDQFYDMP